MTSAADIVRPLLSQVRVPGSGDRIYKDECAYSFDSPFSPEGIYLNLSTHIAYGRRFVELDHARTGQRLYLCLRRVPAEVPAAETVTPPPEKKARVLGIGVEGGFDADAAERKFNDAFELVIVPEWHRIPLPNNELPDLISVALTAITSAPSALRRDEVVAWVADKDTPISAHAMNLQQLPGITVPARGWKCRNCDLTENLWMNLTDGAINCGRRNWDGTGGNGHALEHYNENKYPLSVKLATINSDGAADIYSYPEDNMVADPLLKEHLEHFGLRLSEFVKTEKNLAELELDANTQLEFSAIQESGRALEPATGPGHTGLRNLGNSCYMASVLQVLFRTASFRARYLAPYDQIVQRSTGDASQDLNLQLAKIADGLWSGRYSADSVVPEGAPSPRAFKTLIGRGHVEFGTGRQQDASEFYQYLLSSIDRAERAAGTPHDTIVSHALTFRVIERLQDTQSGMVRYSERTDNLIAAPIPIERAVNRDLVSATVRPLVPLGACLEAFAAEQTIEGFTSPATGQRGTATSAVRLGTMPDVLFIQAQRFAFGADGRPVKLDVRVDAPDEIDIAFLRGSGLQPGETTLPDEPAAAAPAGPAFNEEVVQGLQAMGFSRNACIRAAVATKSANADEAANWLFAHMEDPDLNDELPSAAAPAGAAPVNEETVMLLEAMGFKRAHAERALRETGGDGDRAAEWLFSRADSLDNESTEQQPAEQQAASTARVQPVDGSSVYRLAAFVSHMGTSTGSGHYVCHIREGDKWILFNDAYVAVSQEPPREYGYLYMYVRA